MAFWRRKKDEEFVSLGLSRAAAEPAPQTQNETATELPAPVATRESEAMPGRAPWQTSVLGLDLSIEELQAQEKALEQALHLDPPWDVSPSESRFGCVLRRLNGATFSHCLPLNPQYGVSTRPPV